MKSPYMYTAKISAQGQITVPSEVRKKIGAEKGQYVRFYLDGDALALASTTPIEKYFGKVNILGGEDPVEFIRKLRDDSARRVK